MSVGIQNDLKIRIIIVAKLDFTNSNIATAGYDPGIGFSKCACGRVCIVVT